jgi:acetoin utilization deacetylase AcuC-like enzyme
VAFFSIHRFGMGFYPGTGDKDETGRGKGQGYTFNEPVRHGTARKEYHARFSAMLEKAANKIKPELVLLSAGFDAHKQDPIGSLGLETEDFTTLSRQVLQVAKTHAQGRLVSCLEGGYHLEALAESVQVHLEELLAVKE